MIATERYRIRQATQEDFDETFKVLREFHIEALQEFGVKFEEDMVYKCMKETCDTTLILEVDNKIVGLIAGKLVDYPFQNAKIFQEQIWYVLKDYRRYGRKLLEALEERLITQGISALIMVNLSNSMNEKLTRFYSRMGYQLMESHYLKRLK